MQKTPRPSFFHSLRFRYGIALVGFLALGGYFAWQKYEEYFLQFLPPLLVLGACLGMHMFMHRGHSHGHSENHTKNENQTKQINKWPAND